MGKIIDKIQSRRKQRRTNRYAHSSTSSQPTLHGDENTASPLPGAWYYSFEFFPPKTEAGEDNLLTRINRMTRRLDPLFLSVTWGGAGSTAARSIAVASHAQKYCGVDVLMHLAVQGMTVAQLSQVLEQAKGGGIQNILALRGDPPRGTRSWREGDVSGGDLDRSVDLVRFIRERYGDYFGIAVAGHPEGHPSSVSLEEEMKYLKEKIDVGADFIITQLFYDTDAFLAYVKNCRVAGIEVPILPGIMPIQSYNSFKRMTEYCNVAVPKSVVEKIEPVKDDDEAVKEIGCEIAAEMCRRILADSGEDVDGVHFYTLNLERSVTRILKLTDAIDFVEPASSHRGAASQDGGSSDGQQSGGETARSVSPSLAATVRATNGRTLPWRPSAIEGRNQNEHVRPINWSNRPMSYVMRTEDWDEFPNGRWGDATSPAFGELSDLSHFYSFSLGNEEDQLAILGHSPTAAKDVYEVFARYVEGEIPYIPWCETPLQPESFLIQPQLATLNRAGFLTINSQPSVNAALSTHETFGWGGPGGYVYQKAYCELFCSPENTQRLVDMVHRHETMHIYAVNIFGDEIKEGTDAGGVTALTWGVFPNKEILQPTVFDPSAFLVWAEEAFSLWTRMWLNLYDFDSESYELIETIRDTYYLCAIIDNDFVSDTDKGGSSIWKVMCNVEV
jgi:methylenetetrahydrofolate reductase (NADPH)